MRKFIFMFAGTIMLACGITMVANDYRSEFFTLIDENNYNAADSVLALWTAESPDNPEVQVARFNLLFNSSRNSMLSVNNGTDYRGDHLVFSDSLGHHAGIIGEHIEWNDSLYNEAINVIGNSVRRWPERLDMRWGMAKAESERNRWKEVAEIVNAVLDRSEETGFAWTWADGVALKDSAEIIVNAGAFDYLSMMLSDEEGCDMAMADSLASRISEIFPNDCRVLNILGSIRYNNNDIDKALEYFIKADEACPGDGIIAGNIAYLYFENGNEEKALELYSKIVDDPNYDEASRENARTMISVIRKEFEEMRKYTYFFNYLPVVASVTSIADGDKILSTPEIINTTLAAYNRMKSPFNDSEISVTPVTIDENIIYVWKFPEPTEVPLCLYVAFVPNGVAYAVYTLEKSFNNAWVIGTQKDKEHSNFGDIDNVPATAEEFAMLLKKREII